MQINHEKHGYHVSPYTKAGEARGAAAFISYTV